MTPRLLAERSVCGVMTPAHRIQPLTLALTAACAGLLASTVVCAVGWTVTAGELESVRTNAPAGWPQVVRTLDGTLTTPMPEDLETP